MCMFLIKLVEKDSDRLLFSSCYVGGSKLNEHVQETDEKVKGSSFDSSALSSLSFVLVGCAAG